MPLIYDQLTKRWKNTLDVFSRTHLCFEASRWDGYNWEQFLGLQPSSKKTIKAGESRIYSFPGWAEEVFHRLYSVPQRLEDGQIKPENQWAKEAHEQLDVSPEFQALTQSCRGSRFFAGTGADRFIQEFVARMPEPTVEAENPEKFRAAVMGLKMHLKQLGSIAQQVEQRQQALKQQQETLQQQREELEAQEELTPEQEAELQRIADALQQAAQKSAKMDQKAQNVADQSELGQQQLAEAIAQGKAAVAAAQAYAEQLAQVSSGAIAAAAAAAQQAVDEEKARQEGFGWGTGMGAHTPQDGGDLALKMKFSQKLSNSEKLKQIAKIAGRLKAIAAKKQASKVKEARHELQSIEQGDDLARILPSELLKLAVPELRPLFMQDYVEKRLLQYALDGKEPAERGPIILCLDSSGSMSNDQREEWSKAVALAMMSIATAQKRHFRLMHFTGRVERTDDFPPGKVDPTALIKAIEVFYNGGSTLFEPVLNKAVECIRKEGSLKKADIVFITDGDSDVSASWLKQFEETKRELEFSVYGVCVGSVNTTQLRRFSDRVVCVKRTQDDQEIETVFEI